MTTSSVNLDEKRRILQLETLYDLAVALKAERPEEELVEELLQRVCSVLDPAAAVAITRDAFGGLGAVAAVGWPTPPKGTSLLASPLGDQLLAQGRMLTLRDGELLDRSYRELMVVPLICRQHILGFVAVMDKEVRGADAPDFTPEDQRFLESVGALAGLSLDSARQLALLATQRQRLEEENKILKGRFVEEVSGRRIIAHAPKMREVLALAERIAPRGVNVLVRGESGTGKELIAELLHVGSGRTGALIAVNCAALPESLLESELFGIEGGVATGVKARPGKFELADGGTLFLDEIGDMQPAIQAKLLRALQEREVTKVGGRRPIAIDVRVVAATHRELESLVREGEFREDLYYRLKGVELELPPLRQRRGDIPHLVRHFAETFCEREGIPLPTFRADASALLLSHDYPGNVRELQNLVAGAVSVAEGEVTRELIASFLSSPGTVEAEPTTLDLASVEHQHIERVLRLTQGNKTAAARILGIDRRTLARKGF
jgi:transcriptional regulator with GAF, ATPase, and Fis domain